MPIDRPPHDDDGPRDAAQREARRFLPLRERGETDLDSFWGSARGAGAGVDVLAGLVKVDLQCRFRDGEAPAAAEYFDRFPELRGETDRVLSLVYEEFCLLEENHKGVTPQAFCDRYPDWRDSLESQLRYHREFSKDCHFPVERGVPPIGGTFEQFQIVSELGRGGGARVYLAEDLSLANRQVVLKVSLDRGTEHEVLARLRHAHIVPVLSVSYDGESESLLRGLCLEYRPGLALDEVIRRLDLPPAAKADARGLWRGPGATADPAPVEDGSRPSLPGQGTTAH